MPEWGLAEAVRFLTEEEPAVAFAVLLVSSAVEYVFPPFPGDTVTIAGAVLVTGYGYSLPAVVVAVMAGGLVGAAADYWVGRQVARGASTWLGRLGVVRRAAAALDRVSRSFARHGEAYIVVNRFLPGVRAFLFVAAGLAGMRFWRVMLWAAVSSLAWNALLLVAGMAVGANLETLEGLARRYTEAVWAALGVLAVGILVRWWVRRRRRKRPSSG